MADLLTNISKHNITIFYFNSKNQQQVTSNFAAAKTPICDCPWLFVTILSLVKPVADTPTMYALLLKLIPRYRKQDQFDKNMGTILGIKI